MKKEYIFNTTLGMLAAAKAFDINSHGANNKLALNSEAPLPGLNFITEKVSTAISETSSAYANLDIEVPVSKDFEKTMRSNIRGRLTILAENLDDNFPSKKKYAFNSGDPVGLVMLDPSEFDISRLTIAICGGEVGSDLGRVRKHHLTSAIGIINEAMQSEGIPLKLSHKTFTQPNDFYNPFNREIKEHQLMKPRQLASPTDKVWGSQGLFFSVECNTIFGHPQALAETGDFYSFDDNAHLREELSFKVAFFKRFVGLIGPGTQIHEIFHNIIKGHPHESMHFDPTNSYDMAILRTMCKPINKLGSSMMYVDECKKLPEFSEEDYVNYGHDPKIAQIGIMELFATKVKFNPDGLQKHLAEAEDLLYQEAKIQYQLVTAAQRQAAIELEEIMKKDHEMSPILQKVAHGQEKTTPDRGNQYFGIGIATVAILTTALAYKLIPAMLGYKKLREAQDKNLVETIGPASEVIPSPPLTVGSFFREVGSHLAENIVRDFREPYQNLKSTVQSLQIAASTSRQPELNTEEVVSVPWQRDPNWEEEVNRIDQLLKNNILEPENVNDGHLFSQGGQDFFIGINKNTGIMYGARYDNHSEYPHVYALPSTLQVNAPTELNAGDVMTFRAGSIFIVYEPENAGLRFSKTSVLKMGESKVDKAIQNWQRRTGNQLFRLSPQSTGPLSVTRQGDADAQGVGHVIIKTPHPDTAEPVHVVLTMNEFSRKIITGTTFSALAHANPATSIEIRLHGREQMLTQGTSKSKSFSKSRS